MNKFFKSISLAYSLILLSGTIIFFFLYKTLSFFISAFGWYWLFVIVLNQFYSIMLENKVFKENTLGRRVKGNNLLRGIQSSFLAFGVGLILLLPLNSFSLLKIEHQWTIIGFYPFFNLATIVLGKKYVKS